MLLRSIVVGCAMLTACSRHPRVDDDVHNVTLNDAQKTQINLALAHLKDQFNAGACQSIYEEANAGFHIQTAQDWLRDCEQLRMELGSLRRVDVKETEGVANSPLQVLVYGAADFEKENQQICINWIVGDKGALLSWLGFRHNDREHWLGSPSRPSRIFDPLLPPKDPTAS